MYKFYDADGGPYADVVFIDSISQVFYKLHKKLIAEKAEIIWWNGNLICIWLGLSM